MKYLTIDLSNESGFDTAEKLQEEGWKVYSVGFYTIIMEKDEENVINQKGE